jgi:SpoVK/Ycf46/Vps4 family AAA+-type ATPase
VASICRDAYGSVLFIDEAYTLANAHYREGSGFAREAVDALIAQMENHREDFMVILSGYPKDMERLMKLNAGFAGRVPYVIEFPNYSRKELAQIFMAMLKESSFHAGKGLKKAVNEYFMGLDSSIIESETFSNARFVRNIFEKTWSKTVMRAQINGSPEAEVTVEDFQAATAEDVQNYLDKTGREPRPGYHLGLL